MEAVSIVIVITLAFAATNLFAQLAATGVVGRSRDSASPGPTMSLEHPFSSHIAGMPRTRTDRHDLQLAIGHDFAAPDVEESVWPRV